MSDDWVNSRTGAVRQGGPPPITDPPYAKYVIYVAVGIVAFVLIAVLAAGGCKAYNRYQARQDAENAVKITHINIDRAQQQAQINRAQIAATQAEAQKRYVQSVGIRRAQDEISRTLTPLYIQWEAIQAQLAMAHSENHTMIWAPSGANGAPLVFPQNP
jgi:hypothetical protein